MSLGYIVIEQIKGSTSFYTVKYDFTFSNNKLDFNKYGIPQEVLDKVETKGVAQFEFVNGCNEEILLTIIKRDV